MKKFDAKFIKYSVTLFVVSVLFISIGAVSLTRSSERTDKASASAKSRIEVLSDENVKLKQEMEALKEENRNLSETAERFSALNSIFEAEKMIESGYYEDALICLEKIDKKYVEGSFATQNYEKLLEIAKENVKND
ncbi:MAG: hypothetical protein IJE46_06415 [Clostridia bacterium]|nr:hypothetical protein [Clostridia bacterium]